jgi:hypothetical protein
MFISLYKGLGDCTIALLFCRVLDHFLYYKLSAFLSVDMEILSPWSSQVHPEAQPKGVQATEGC